MQPRKQQKASAERGSWSVPEFAARHGFSRSFVYEQVAAGLLECVRIPTASGKKVIRVLPEHERAWLGR